LTTTRITEQVEGANGQPLTLNLPGDQLPPGQPQALTTDEAMPVQPAFQPNAVHQGGSASQKSQEGSPTSVKSRSGSTHQRRQPPGRPPPLPPYPSTYTNNMGNNSNGGTRLGRSGAANGIMVESPTGGVQVTLDGGGSWSDLARQDATLPTDAAGVANEGSKADSSSGGVFGFLSRKKGRGNSPKPKERGVLGKEGARVVIG
jgi:serine/threonine kinase 32